MVEINRSLNLRYPDTGYVTPQGVTLEAALRAVPHDLFHLYNDLYTHPAPKTIELVTYPYGVAHGHTYTVRLPPRESSQATSTDWLRKELQDILTSNMSRWLGMAHKPTPFSRLPILKNLLKAYAPLASQESREQLSSVLRPVERKIGSYLNFYYKTLSPAKKDKIVAWTQPQHVFTFVDRLLDKIEGYAHSPWLVDPKNPSPMPRELPRQEYANELQGYLFHNIYTAVSHDLSQKAALLLSSHALQRSRGIRRDIMQQFVQSDPHFYIPRPFREYRSLRLSPYSHYYLPTFSEGKSGVDVPLMHEVFDKMEGQLRGKNKIGEANFAGALKDLALDTWQNLEPDEQQAKALHLGVDPSRLLNEFLHPERAKQLQDSMDMDWRPPDSMPEDYYTLALRARERTREKGQGQIFP